MKALQAQQETSLANATKPSQSMRKHYAQRIFNRATEAPTSDSGFWQKSAGMWELKAGHKQENWYATWEGDWQDGWNDGDWCSQSQPTGRAGARQGLSKMSSTFFTLAQAVN